MAQIDFKEATILIKDGGAGSAQQSLEVKIGEGNFQYTEQRTIEYTLDRGLLDEVREGDEVPVDVTLDAIWDYISGGTATGAVPTVEDALKRRGPAAAWVSTDADSCRPYAVDLCIDYQPDCSASSVTQPDELITISDFRYEQIDHDLRAGTLSITGRANVTEATAVRS